MFLGMPSIINTHTGYVSAYPPQHKGSPGSPCLGGPSCALICPLGSIVSKNLLLRLALAYDDSFIRVAFGSRSIRSARWAVSGEVARKLPLSNVYIKSPGSITETGEIFNQFR